MPGKKAILAWEPRIRGELLLAWAVFWLIGIACAFLLDNAPDLYRFRLSLAISESAAALALWVFCHWLWKREWSWTWRIVVAGVTTFVLGFVCSVGSEWLVPWGDPETHHLRASLTLGTYESVLTSFPLVACVGIYFAAWQWQAVRERETRLLLAEKLAREAELRALRAELTPHFLFNTLNGISTLVGEGHVQEARGMIARLGDFLRATLENAGESEVSLEREINYLQDYLAIEQVRLGDRLQQRVHLDPLAADSLVPTLLLQPLLENAIRHGIAPSPTGGELTVHTRRKGARVYISIANTIHHDISITHRGGGVGLENCRERLAATYGDAAGFTVRKSVRRWEVSIEFPFRAARRTPGGEAKRA